MPPKDIRRMAALHRRADSRRPVRVRRNTVPPTVIIDARTFPTTPKVRVGHSDHRDHYPKRSLRTRCDLSPRVAPPGTNSGRTRAALAGLSGAGALR